MQIGKREISIGVLVGLSAVTLAGCSLLGGSSETPDPKSTECFATGKEITGNTDLKATLVYKEDQTDVENFELKLEELGNYQYGLMGELGDREYHGAVELCNLDSGEVIEEGEYVYEGFSNFPVKSNPNAIGEARGHSTSFAYEVDGVEEFEITEPGNYSINTFSSFEEGVWELSDTIEFKVVE